MGKMNKFAVTVIVALGSTPVTPVIAQDVLTGDIRLACEALLCLSSGVQPAECAPSLARYFGIRFKKWSDTVRARSNFLNLCPTSGTDDTNMRNLTSTLETTVNRCDAISLNSSQQTWQNGRTVINNQMPEFCATSFANSYTDQSNRPMYVGQPIRGGHWVPASEYQRALTDYNTRVAAEDAQRALSGN